MSAEQLSKLSLRDTMVTTRAAARALTSSSQNPQESPTSSPISPTPSLIESLDGHVYDVSAFDEDLRLRAKRGLVYDNVIRMRSCGETEDGAKYVFHLEDDITVSVQGERAPGCSCGATQDKRACKHIFWILGQLSSALPKNQAIQLAEDGSSVRNDHPADVIQRYTLQRIADELDWTFEDDTFPEEDELIDEVANMLSVFEPTEALPAEFKNENMRGLTELSQKYREFQTVIVENAMRYPAFFIQLRDLLTPEFQVDQFFKKINNRIDRAFMALDEYIEKGPTNTRSEALDVVNCAQRLGALVAAIEEYYDESLVSDAGERRDDFQIEKLSVATLVRILDEVTRRNFDAYANSTWGMPSTDPKENNLFVCLIGPASEDQGFFILTPLQDRAPEAVRHHVADLFDIEGRLRNTPLTPPAYLDAFRTLINDKRKRAASQSAGSSAKRPMQRDSSS
ncbi:hypothetical protein N0V90_003103 [Kalmusia sp. IMI 367209]|nr:hypothetical protein N0V90_003103 [Kalmusia sp. IMI 367209]